MYQSVNFNDFLNAFASHGRENQFSYEAKQIIFDYIEDFERDTGESVELDIIAICCDFNEDTAENIQRYYSIEHDIDDEGSLEKSVREHLEDNSCIIGEHTIDGITYFVYQSF